METSLAARNQTQYTTLKQKLKQIATPVTTLSVPVFQTYYVKMSQLSAAVV